MAEFKIKNKRGVNDLKPIYAFYSLDMGGGETNDIKVHGDERWGYNWQFEKRGIDPTDQEAINKESDRISKENENYIAQLKSEGRYGEEYEISFHIESNPVFDADDCGGSAKYILKA